VKKILLINPCFSKRVYAPTLGLGFLATYIKKNIYCDAEVIEPVKRELNKKTLLQKVKKTDFLGLTCYTESRFECFEFAQQAKLINPNCQIIIGGCHATALDKQILQHYPFIDIIVRSEGEQALLAIVQQKPLEEIKGVTWRRGSEIIRNPDQEFEKEISRYHFDYSLIWREINNWKDDEIPYRLQKTVNLPIIASRGCLFHCAFCGAHEQWRGLWRGHLPEELVEQIVFLNKKYKVGYFRFYDALFIGAENQILEFCRLLEKSKLDIKFRIDIRVGTSQFILKRLRQVGCQVVGFGVESGSNKILKRINKGITREQIEQTINICKSLGYWTIGFFMISLPDETQDDFNKTKELFKYFDVFNLQFFKIHPNTIFYQELKHKGEINDEIWFNKDYGEEIFYSKEMFPSANFYRQDVEKNIKFFYLKHDIKKSRITLKRYGLIKGVLRYIFSSIQFILLQNEKSTEFLRRIRTSLLVKRFKNYFFNR